MIIKGEKDTFNLTIKFEVYENFYTINALSHDSKIMGRINFKVDFNKAWIYSIKTFDEYQSRGVGQALLDACEYISCKNGVKCIQGKYYPSNEYAKPFYEKNGYKITKEYYETFIIKYINYKKTLDYLADKVIIDELNIEVGL